MSTRRRHRELVRPLVAFGASLALVLVALTVGGPGTEEAAQRTWRSDLRNGRSFIQDNLWSTAREQYAVWVSPASAPYVGKRARPRGRWQVVDLSRLAGNPLGAPVRDDEHNVFAIAVDSLGYVHVAGNMHDSPLRYIRSQRPGDITAWEAAGVAGPATSVTYPAFVALPDGTLQFWRREGVSGDGAEVVDTLAPEARSWRSLGVVVDGRPTGESPYLHHVAVDPRTGTEHLMFEWRGNGDPITNNDVGYARSADGGRTWQGSGGRPLASPITHANAEVVLDTAPEASGLLNGGGLTVADGHPHGIVVFEPPAGVRRLVHVWHDGRRWHESDLAGNTVLGRPAIAGLRNGHVWLLGVADGAVRAVDVAPQSKARRRTVDRVPAGWEPTFDSQALARAGRVEVLVPRGIRPRVVRAVPPG